MPVITFDMLNDRVIARLIDAGAASEHARIVAESLTYAEASGIVSHGLVRLPFLLEQTRTGKIDGTAEPELRATSSGLLVCDARHGYGYVAAHHTVTSMIASLHSGAGFVLASISNSHHFGVAGQWAERLAEQGFVGLVTSSTFGAIAPLGGHTATLGNPSLALGLPTTQGDPLVVDLAPAVAARGLIAAAAARGETIPPEWALDAEGNPTTDPTTALSGTIQAVGGHKGVALAMLLDSLLLATTAVDVRVGFLRFSPQPGHRPDSVTC
jgi:(2R)-3-sulfolactate dehydrogenase (NADP+)